MPDRTTVHLSIRPNSYWHAETGRTLVDGQFGERSVRLAISDTDQVGELLRALYDAAAVEVSGPVWELTGDNPIHGEVRQAAAQEARHRAEDYAAGLGLSIGGVAHVTEPGLRTEPPGVMRSLAMAGGSELSTGPTVDLGTAEISVSASVDVGFRIEPPR